MIDRQASGTRGSGLISISSAVLCELLGALCGYSERWGETAQDKTEGHAEKRREGLTLPIAQKPVCLEAGVARLHTV